MNPKRQSPEPIIDGLQYIQNPFQLKIFSAKAFMDNPISGADQDLEFVLKFLYSYNGSTATFNSYRRELERLLQWAWRIEQRSVISIQREHIEAFIEFCTKPPIGWIGTKNVARFKSNNGARIANPDWRPFVVSITKDEFKMGKSPEP